jgi:tagatose 6-phosphate kinase
MRGHVLTVTLNPAIDKTIRGKKINLSAGGKGINVSRALDIFGIKNTATGIIGGKSGDHVASLLKKEKIKNDFFRIKKDTRTNLTVISPGSGRIFRKIGKGPAVSVSEFAGFKKKFRSLLKGCRFAVFSGANANGLPDSAYAELIKIAAKKGIKASLDTRDAPLARGLKARPFLVKPNLEETECAKGRGANITLVTLGAGGAVAFGGKKLLFAKPPRLKAVNDVGCGDAFLAGFIAYYLKGKGLEDCVRAATAAGAANTLSLRPGAFKKRDFEKLMEKVKVEAI